MNRNRLVPREEVDAHGIVPIDEPGTAGTTPPISPRRPAPYGVEVNAGWRVPFTDMLCTQPPTAASWPLIWKPARFWGQAFRHRPQERPFGIPSMLPFDIGTPNNAGAVVTASGLIFHRRNDR